MHFPSTTRPRDCALGICKEARKSFILELSIGLARHFSYMYQPNFDDDSCCATWNNDDEWNEWTVASSYDGCE